MPIEFILSLASMGLAGLKAGLKTKANKKKLKVICQDFVNMIRAAYVDDPDFE